MEKNRTAVRTVGEQGIFISVLIPACPRRLGHDGLPESDPTREPIALVPFMNLEQFHYFLPYIGIGLHLDSNKYVSEILIARIPVAQ